MYPDENVGRQLLSVLKTAVKLPRKVFTEVCLDSLAQDRQGGRIADSETLYELSLVEIIECRFSSPIPFNEDLLQAAFLIHIVPKLNT